MFKKLLTIAMIGTSLVSFARVNMFFRDAVLACLTWVATSSLGTQKAQTKFYTNRSMKEQQLRNSLNTCTKMQKKLTNSLL